MKKAEKLEFEQLKNVSGGSGPTDEDVTAGVRAYCGNCQSVEPHEKWTAVYS